MRLRLLAVVAALATAMTACASGQETPDVTADQPAAAGEATFVGLDNLQWQETSKSAEIVDGALEVSLECAGAVPHNVVFEGVDDDAVIAECSGNDTATGTVEVEPGTYTYYCSIPGHRGAGMEGEITVS